MPVIHSEKMMVSWFHHEYVEWWCCLWWCLWFLSSSVSCAELVLVHQAVLYSLSLLELAMVVSEKGWYGLLYWYYSVASFGDVYLRNPGCVRIWKSSCVGCSGFSGKIPLTVRFQYGIKLQADDHQVRDLGWELWRLLMIMGSDQQSQLQGEFKLREAPQLGLCHGSSIMVQLNLWASENYYAAGTWHW